MTVPKAALEEQREWLRVTLASIGDAVITTDTAGNVTFLNPVAETLTGWPQSEAEGEPLSTVFHIINERTRQHVESPADRALKEGVIVGLANHTLLIAKDGTERPIDDSAAPIRNRSGEVAGVVLVFRDITERRRQERLLHESESRKAAKLRAAPDGIITIDHEGRVIEFNPAAERMFGYRRDEILGHKMADLIIPRVMRQKHAEGFARYLGSGEPSVLDKRLELIALRADGQEFPIEITVTKIEIDGPPMFTAFIRDISERKQAEELQARLAAIVDSSDDAIISKSLTGFITTWNNAAERLLGYTAAEIVGRPVTVLIPPERQDEEPRILQKLQRGERVDHFETVRLTKSGKRIDVSLTISPVKDAAGKIIGASKIMRDIGQRKAAEAALRRSEVRYRRLFESAHDGMLILDAATGKITEANPFIVELLGYSLDELRGKELWQIGIFRDIDNSRATIRKLQEKGVVRYDHLPLETKAGRRVEVEVVANVYEEDEKVAIQCSLRDITDRRDLEQQAREQAQALAELHRRKDEFLAMLSHELRNPLAPILNAIQLLRTLKAGTKLQQEAHAMIERQVGQLARLVDDLLEVSRISTGRIHLQQEPIDLRKVVVRAIETTRPEVSQKNHALAQSLPDAPVWVNGDATRLEQVIVNLLNNACKYTDPGGHISVGLEQGDGEAVVRVHDNGIGITPEMLPRIFDLFSQADKSLDRSQGGLGIGLALVQSLVSMHRGRVEAHSTQGRGSEFVVALPVIPVPDSSRSEGARPAASPRRALRVLVVDDNQDAARGVGMLLRTSGHDVRMAFDGPGALQAALEYVPQAVLLDIGLPGVNGYEVAQWIRQEPSLQGVLLVALTGYGQESDRQRTQEAGFDHHLVKPADYAKIEQILATVPH